MIRGGGWFVFSKGWEPPVYVTIGGNRVVLQSARILNITNSIIINLYYACAYYISYRLRRRRPGAVPYIIIRYIKYIIAMVVQRRHNIIVVWSWISCALYNRIYIGTLWRVIVVYIIRCTRNTLVNAPTTMTRHGWLQFFTYIIIICCTLSTFECFLPRCTIRERDPL